MHLNRIHISSTNIQNLNTVIPEQSFSVPGNNDCVSDNNICLQESDIQCSNMPIEEIIAPNADDVSVLNTATDNNVYSLNSETALLVS